MKYVQILNEVCSGDIDSCCSDYGVAQYIYAIKQALEIIHFIVPIILIIMIAIQLIKMLSSPDDPQSKKMKSLLNKIIAAVLIFFIPFIADLLVSLLPNSYSVASCWQSADDTVTRMNEYENDGYDEEFNRKNVDKDYELFNGKASETSEESDNSNDKNKTNNNNDDNSSNVDTGSPNGTDTASKKVKNKRKKVVEYALKFVGNPYVWGGNSLTHGVDCSGFVQQVYKKFGYSLPRTSREQSKVGKKITTKNLQKGDLIFYYEEGTTTVGHVALYIGNKKVVHASNPKDGIKISTYNYRTPAVIRRIITK